MIKKILIVSFLFTMAIKGYSQYDGFHLTMGWRYNYTNLKSPYWYQPSTDSIGTVYNDRFYFHHFVFRFFGKGDDMYIAGDAAPLLDIALFYLKDDLWAKNGRLKKIGDYISGASGNANDWALLDFDMCFGGQSFYSGLHFAIRNVGIVEINDAPDIERFKNTSHARLGLSNFYFHDEFRFGLKLDFLAGNAVSGIGYSPSVMYIYNDVFFFSGYYRLTKLYRKDGIYEDDDAVLTPAQESIEVHKANTFGISAGIFL